MRFRTILMTALVLLCISGTAFAGDIPNALGDLKIGAQAPEKLFVQGIKAFDFEWSATINKTMDGKIWKLKGVTVKDGDTKIDGGDVNTTKALAKLREKLVAQIGQPTKSEPGDDETFGRFEWKNDTLHLTLAVVEPVYDTFAMTLTIESLDTAIIGDKRADYLELYEQFRSALQTNDHDALFGFFATPFEDKYFASHDPASSRGFTDKAGFEAKYNDLFNAKARERLLKAKPLFDKNKNCFYIDYDVSSLLVKNVDGQWKITELIFVP